MSKKYYIGDIEKGDVVKIARIRADSCMSRKNMLGIVGEIDAIISRYGAKKTDVIIDNIMYRVHQKDGKDSYDCYIDELELVQKGEK